MATASQVISTAKHEVGYKESGTNHTKYADEVPDLHWAQNQPWCSTFIAWVALKANARDIFPCTASCLTGVDWFKHYKRWSKTPVAGAVVYYGPAGGTHVELVTEVTADRIKTVGGNTSGNLKGAYHNGDGVFEKWVDRDEPRIYGYGLPAYDAEPKPKPKPPIAKPAPVTIAKPKA